MAIKVGKNRVQNIGKGGQAWEPRIHENVYLKQLRWVVDEEREKEYLEIEFNKKEKSGGVSSFSVRKYPSTKSKKEDRERGDNFAVDVLLDILKAALMPKYIPGYDDEGQEFEDFKAYAIAAVKAFKKYGKTTNTFHLKVVADEPYTNETTGRTSVRTSLGLPPITFVPDGEGVNKAKNELLEDQPALTYNAEEKRAVKVYEEFHAGQSAEEAAEPHEVYTTGVDEDEELADYEEVPNAEEPEDVENMEDVEEEEDLGI